MIQNVANSNRPEHSRPGAVLVLGKAARGDASGRQRRNKRSDESIAVGSNISTSKKPPRVGGMALCACADNTRPQTIIDFETYHRHRRIADPAAIIAPVLM